MIQLKVYKSVADQQAKQNPIFIDLYDTEPIKLTLSIEDITTADASSVFSKQFRVPATRDNNEFFENAFEIDGIDFDVTTKKPADILVDGAEFKQGHIRLQKIYVNGDKDRIDYELLFLGETRDFSSQITDKTLCQLIFTDFDWPDNPVTYTNAADFTGPYTYGNITTSWNAFPQFPSVTAGFADGDIVFPLIDHGNTYDDAGTPQQGVITVDTGQNSMSFIQSSNSLALTRLKPMIRAKRVLDQIFEDSGYTYTSDFLNSDRFHQMYISAFGNNEAIGMEIEQITTGLFASANPTTTQNGYEDYVYNMQVFSNAGNYYNVGSLQTGSFFTCPGDASIGGNYYIMNASAEVDGSVQNSDGTESPTAGAVQLVVVNNIGGTIQHVLATGNYTFNGNTSSLSWDSRNGGYQPVAGDIIQLFIITSSGQVERDSVENTYWDCTAAPGDYYAPLDLNCEYKQVDFVKDILTSFRLVMAPDNARPNNFIIEPWQEYIGSGTTYDWSDKIVLDKDVVLEPLFNTQSQDIEFTMQEDEDFINEFHQDNNKHAYGWLRFNSDNELLKGTRKIELNGIAPTPLDQIEHGTNAAHPYPQWVIPTIHTHDDGEHLPIKSKTRLLFYNGLQDILVSQDNWYLNADDSSPLEQDQWPLVSSYENWPVQQTSLNINFSNDTRYYLDPSPGAGYFDQGSTLYNEYWSRYINSLYNKFSRRLTAYFTLNNVDLQYFSFDDIIFVNGKYYRPEKIIDVQVGATTEVQVQLITLKDQRPIWLNEPLDGFSVATFNNNCAGQQGSIQITTRGTPNFTWELVDSGATGVYTAPVGQAPYTFTIDAPVGIDTLIVTDSLGRTAQIQVEVPASTATPITATSIKGDPTICSGDEGLCNGSILVTPSGGSGDYTVTWTDPSIPDGANPTNLCEDTYAYQVIDNVTGCESAFYEVVLECQGQTTDIWKVESCTSPGGYRYVFSTPVGTSCVNPQNAPLQIGQVVHDEVNPPALEGPCYTVIGKEYTEPADMCYDAVFETCESCLGTETYAYEYELCSDPTTIGIASTTVNTWAYGTVVKLEGSDTCVKIRFSSDLTPNAVINDLASYENCDACNGITPALQVCHTILSETAITYEYEFNNQVYQSSLGADQLVAFCAVEGTVTITSGTGTVTASENECVSSRSCTLPSPTVYNYRISDCETDLSWNMSKGNSNFQIGDVIQYQQGSPGSGAIYCGTITSVTWPTGSEDATLANENTSYFCGDTIHCLQ